MGSLKKHVVIRATGNLMLSLSKHGGILRQAQDEEIGGNSSALILSLSKDFLRFLAAAQKHFLDRPKEDDLVASFQFEARRFTLLYAGIVSFCRPYFWAVNTIVNRIPHG